MTGEELRAARKPATERFYEALKNPIKRRPGLYRTVKAIKRGFRPDPDGYLRSCSGVIHVGANTAQERTTYAGYGLPVIWIEPLPAQFERLKQNIKAFPDQIAINGLITDRDDVSTILHVSNNDGLSSSILDLSLHRDMYPDVDYVGDIAVNSVRLQTAISRAGLDISNYDALVMDTQGSELLILRGLGADMTRFKYIKTEAADFESYKGCATVSEISEFLISSYGYRLLQKDRFAQRDAGGGYFDLLFGRT
jgi:FkbM family methyltransferase